MRHLEIIWTGANLKHLADHGISPQEAADVLHDPAREDVSRSSGRPIAIGYTRAGRWIAVVYERVDAMTVYPITAYDIEA